MGRFTRMATLVGSLVVAEYDGAITHIFFENEGESEQEKLFLLGREYQKGKSELLNEAVRQIEQYFLGERKSFCLPIELRASEFGLAVYGELCRIPYGQTATYGEIARKVLAPRAARAVGGACNKNPIAVVIPCHRAVGANGKLVGYAYGLKRKQFLLNLEKATLR